MGDLKKWVNQINSIRLSACRSTHAKKGQKKTIRNLIGGHYRTFKSVSFISYHIVQWISNKNIIDNNIRVKLNENILLGQK